MAFDAAGFEQFYLGVIGGTRNGVASYKVNLRKIDREIDGGIDAFVDRDGFERFIEWVNAASQKLSSKPSDVRSAGKAYVRFRTEGTFLEEALADEPTADENRLSVFRYENELQMAVRAQIGALEAGLRVEDGGSEATFDTGRSDILARDQNGCAVVIELKAGRCPKGAIEQALGYAQDWIESGRESRVRVVLVAGEFPPRIVAAAKRIPDLELKIYELAVRFRSADA